MKFKNAEELARVLKDSDVEVVDERAILETPPRAMPRQGISEHALQAAVIAECDRRALVDPRWGMIFAIPNGQYRRGQRMEPGLRSGVPDLFVPVPSGGYAGAFIELKVGSNKPSDAQREWIECLQEQGYFVAVQWASAVEVVELIEQYFSLARGDDSE